MFEIIIEQFALLEWSNTLERMLQYDTFTIVWYLQQTTLVKLFGAPLSEQAPYLISELAWIIDNTCTNSMKKYLRYWLKMASSLNNAFVCHSLNVL